MGSKAKSGMSAVRQYPETVTTPPNTFAVGASTFTSGIRDGKGHSEYHVGVVNDTAFSLQVQHSWRTTGSFTEDQTIASVLDPVSGLHIAEIIAPVTKKYIKALVTVGGAGLGANFEIGIYFLPRASGPVVTSGPGGGGGASTTIVGITQVQNVETVDPLAASGSFVGAARNCLNYESFGISVYLASDVAGVAIDATAFVENSADGVTWRIVDTILLTGPAPVAPALADPITLNRVYSVCRQYYRVSIENNDGTNALSATEVISMQKPV